MKDPGRKSIAFQLMLAARLHRTRTATMLAEIGLFPGQEQALQMLARHPDGMTMGDLSRMLHVRPPTASKTIARLTAQNLVERESNTPDGRVVRVTLTEQGREKLARIDAMTETLEAELGALFDRKDAKRLRKALRRIVRHLGGPENALDDEEADEAEETEESRPAHME
jgi:DNA-binding MarR family transcriptional regulator